MIIVRNNVGCLDLVVAYLLAEILLNKCEYLMGVRDTFSELHALILRIIID